MTAAQLGKKILKERVVKVLTNAKKQDDLERDAASKMFAVVNPAQHEDIDDSKRVTQSRCVSLCGCCCANDTEKRDSLIVAKTSPSYNDDNFSPMSASGYLKHRIVQKLRFYQERIPGYYLKLNFFTYMVALLTLAASALAVFNVPPSSQFWVSIATALLSAFVGFEKYFDADTKLQRYTKTVKDLKLLVDYWQGLSSLEQNKLSNIETLVDKGEGIILDEISSWGFSQDSRVEELMDAEK